MPYIVDIHAREILDSRGNPTVEVDVVLESGAFGRAAVPSGASTGSLEAVEMRDNDPKRYAGKGVLKAIGHIQQDIAPAIIGMDATEQQVIDHTLIQLDGTENKSRLGANAILGVSLAVAKAASEALHTPLYRYMGGVNATIMPVPMMNIINGGAHADNAIDIQEFMIMPIGATNIADAIRMGAEVFHALKSELKKAKHNTNVGDEGGFAPALASTKQALDFVLQSIQAAGYQAGNDIVIALDAASTEFYSNGKYELHGEKLSLNSDQLIRYYETLVNEYPIISIEDAMAENDHDGWKAITEALGNKIQLVGDDLFVTNPKILKEGINKGLANALLVKVNQIGTLTETLEAVNLAHQSGYHSILSHRSGETEDTTIAHIAVATNCGQIKTGSLSRSDRLAKYNELIRIEEQLNGSARYAGHSILKKAS